MQKEQIKKVAKQNLKEWGIVLGGFAVVSCFLIQPFKIPSGSMVPTLLVGDFLFVNKYCYGYSNDSFRIGTFTIPLPKITTRLMGNEQPKAGEVIVFRNEKDHNLNYIKRVIGVPGDKIELKQGMVYINDKALKIKEIGEFSIMDKNEYVVHKKYIEKLPNGYEHVIIKRVDFVMASLDNVGPFIVPDGHYFVMGDNRDNSQDSRVMEKVGFVPLNNIMGRAMFIFFSSECSWYEVLKWPFSMRFERFFTSIK